MSEGSLSEHGYLHQPSSGCQRFQARARGRRDALSRPHTAAAKEQAGSPSTGPSLHRILQPPIQTRDPLVPSIGGRDGTALFHRPAPDRGVPEAQIMGVLGILHVHDEQEPDPASPDSQGMDWADHRQVRVGGPGSPSVAMGNETLVVRNCTPKSRWMTGSGKSQSLSAQGG